MISETDLILNKNGNIYHLDVNRDNLSTNIILVGDRNRVPLVSKYFDKITHKSQHREFVIHTGYLGNKYLTVMSTGMGVGCIEICINELDAIFNIDFETREIKKELTSINLFRLGTCGAIKKDIPVDSIIVSDYGLGLDNILKFYKGSEEFYELSKYLDINRDINKKYDEILIDVCKLGSYNTYLVEGDINLRNLFPDFIHGITATSPGFYASQNRTLRLKNNTAELIDILNSISYNGYKVVNFEMETSALYGLSKLMGHKSLTLCTVVGNRITKEFNKNVDESVDKMIKYFLNKIIEL